MKTKRIISALLVLCMLAGAIYLSVFAYADDVDWHYDSETKTLYITGTGAMDDYEDPYSTPWNSYILSVEKVVIEDGITYVGNCSFSGASALNEVSLSDTVTKIGENAFASCQNLNELTVGENIEEIADKSFALNGLTDKENFIMNVDIGSYALYYAISNDIPFNTTEARCGAIDVHHKKGLMKSYYPYTAKVDGTYKFYTESNHDTLAYLYDENFTRLKYNDDISSSNTNSMFTATLEKGKKYYFAVGIYSPKLYADITAYLVPVEYTVTAKVYAMNSPDGTASAVELTDATIDGVQVNDGITINVTDADNTVTIACDHFSKEYVLTPDFGEEPTITVMMCDVNDDGIVNAKDYALMKRGNQRFIDFFEPFMNYDGEQINMY